MGVAKELTMFSHRMIGLVPKNDVVENPDAEYLASLEEMLCGGDIPPGWRLLS